jgi:hypothetical protein
MIKISELRHGACLGKVFRQMEDRFDPEELLIPAVLIGLNEGRISCPSA